MFVVGMLLYLAVRSRPDITYTVHQCARFSYNPRHFHEVGMNHVILYLKGTRGKGLLLSPNFK